MARTVLLRGILLHSTILLENASRGDKTHLSLMPGTGSTSLDQGMGILMEDRKGTTWPTFQPGKSARVAMKTRSGDGGEQHRKQVIQRQGPGTWEVTRDAKIGKERIIKTRPNEQNLRVTQNCGIRTPQDCFHLLMRHRKARMPLTTR